MLHANNYMINEDNSFAIRGLDNLIVNYNSEI